MKTFKALTINRLHAEQVTMTFDTQLIGSEDRGEAIVTLSLFEDRKGIVVSIATDDHYGEDEIRVKIPILMCESEGHVRTSVKPLVVEIEARNPISSEQQMVNGTLELKF